MSAVHPARRILLVEDDAELREALAEALEARGHEVQAVVDGEEALKSMRAKLPDIVVLDLMMPVMDGWRFRVEQKRDPALADTPVVAISASESPMAAAVDADLYIQKPVDAPTLLGAIEDVLLTKQRRLEPAKIAQTERMAALGTLAAGLAHEINNPLTYVLLHLTHAVRLLPEVATPQNKKKIERIDSLVRGALEGVERIRGITSGVRAFSRVEELSLTALDVRPIIEAAIKLVMNQIRHRAKLVTDYKDVPPVLANEGRLGQVFLNLLTNAVQALPEGDATAHEVRVSTSTDEQGRVLVDVSDTGEGIPEHLLPRIFEPFFSTKPIGRGTGLGLSISQGIVRSLGGEISVATSQVGRGTTIRVVLPAAQRAAEEDSEPTSDAKTEPRRILVVDDEDGVRQAIKDALPGHEVLTVSSGREALAVLQKDEKFDLLLCDLHMPEVTGMDLYNQLRELAPRLAEKVVFMTGGVFTERSQQFIAREPRPVIEKPLDMERLRSLIARTPK